MVGKIYSINAGKYYINDESGKIHILPAAGVLRYKNNSPVVGDFVKFDEDKHLSNILERKNLLIRPKVANIDNVLIVMSIVEPNFSTFLVDKYMAYIEANNIVPILVITKNDIDNFDTCSKIENEYISLGYRVISVNYNNNIWVDKIKSIFKNHTNVLMGQSGVGKTTLINKITNSNYYTQEISKNANRGKHTTRVVQIVNAFDGELIDTPGFSSLDIHFSKTEIAKSFKQFKELGAFCKFKSCLHCNEPEEYCNIKLSVKNNVIPLFRYENYLKILKEIKNDK
ncbi:ribosome small subunit-dependent GTPase A [Mycoplasmopsis felifaucium]|uniref:Small ribosomal subunit biogenesis GTPase RsgA n=1 Tax=Mycoplasmopsis felifaucium TaxID=35768 RepID=A0ABZ2RPE8_9BACT